MEGTRKSLVIVMAVQTQPPWVLGPQRTSFLVAVNANIHGSLDDAPPMRLRATCLLALALCQVAVASNLPRQDSSTTATTSAATTPPPTSTTTTTTSSSSSSSTTSTTSETTPMETTESTTSTTSPTNTPPPETTPANPNTPPPGTSTFLTTEADGDVATVVVTQTGTSTTSSASASATTKSEDEDDSPAIGTGAIVGMSVAGGLALIGIIAFFVWKFTRKRASFDDNEAIKWPDLNSHSGADTGVAVPAHTTGRSGGFDSQSETTGSLMHADNYSTADFASNDPYAVPPLPHLNPNQPYRDDPTAAGGYYDPYRGPVPGTIDHGTGEWHGEAIPMQQIQHQQTGGGFPAGGYDQVGFEQPGYNAGRASPGPHAAFAGDQLGRTGSPAPTMAPPYQQGGHDGYDGSMPPQVGRQSPGPQQAYGGRMSPGPNMAYNAGYNQGPAPGYHDGYGPR